MLLKVAACFVLLFAVVPAQSEEDICTLPADPGPCYAIIPNWFFNSQSGKCERFDYGGWVMRQSGSGVQFFKGVLW
ncbi:hypothetical protein BSKO_14129 [Bryopsis sp. KO-2023]|nr:hypothetical protein BSKO_14129 [Bryopsis sp. KO-2023]